MYKKIIIFSTLLISANISYSQVKLNKEIFQSKVLVASHRGDWRNFPENSLMAYESAIKLGVDIIETDLALTKDSVLVIMHDKTIDRTTNGKGSPSEYTLSELRKLKLKNGIGIVSNHTIPTFKEVMLLAKGRVWVNLDKSYPYFREAYAVLKETNTVDHAIFKSNVDYKTLVNKYSTLVDSINYMPVVDLTKPAALDIINEYNNKLVPYAYELIFNSDVTETLKKKDQIISKGSKIWINSLWASLNNGHYDDMAVEENKADESWGWIINSGATMIQTDRPKELLEYLRNKGLHK